MIALRAMSQADVAAIKRWPSYPPDFAELDYALREGGWLDEFHGQPDQCCEVAVVDGKLIGFALLLKSGDEAEYRIALHPERLGQGYGQAITRVVLERAFAEMGLARVHLIVRQSNPRARRLYEKQGFGAVGECVIDIQGEPVAFVAMEIRAAAFRQ